MLRSRMQNIIESAPNSVSRIIDAVADELAESGIFTIKEIDAYLRLSEEYGPTWWNNPQITEGRISDFAQSLISKVKSVVNRGVQQAVPAELDRRARETWVTPRSGADLIDQLALHKDRARELGGKLAHYKDMQKSAEKRGLARAYSYSTRRIDQLNAEKMYHNAALNRMQVTGEARPENALGQAIKRAIRTAPSVGREGWGRRDGHVLAGSRAPVTKMGRDRLRLDPITKKPDWEHDPENQMFWATKGSPLGGLRVPRDAIKTANRDAPRLVDRLEPEAPRKAPARDVERRKKEAINKAVSYARMERDYPGQTTGFSGPRYPSKKKKAR